MRLQLTVLHGRHCPGIPVQGLVEFAGHVKHCGKKSVREKKQFSNISLQLTFVHVPHLGGIPVRDDTVRIAISIRRIGGKGWAVPRRIFAQTPTSARKHPSSTSITLCARPNSRLQSSAVNGCEYGLSSGEHGQKKYYRNEFHLYLSLSFYRVYI